MPADPRMLELLSYYRDAALSAVQVKLTLPVAQGTRHAWLWTERMRELGGWPAEVSGHQVRIGMHDGRIVRDVAASSRPALHLVSDADPA